MIQSNSTFHNLDRKHISLSTAPVLNRQLSPAALGLYYTIKVLGDQNIDVGGLAELFSMSRDTVSRILKELRETGYLKMACYSSGRGRFTWSYGTYDDPVNPDLTRSIARSFVHDKKPDEKQTGGGDQVKKSDTLKNEAITDPYHVGNLGKRKDPAYRSIDLDLKDLNKLDLLDLDPVIPDFKNKNDLEQKRILKQAQQEAEDRERMEALKAKTFRQSPEGLVANPGSSRDSFERVGSALPTNPVAKRALEFAQRVAAAPDPAKIAAAEARKAEEKKAAAAPYYQHKKENQVDDQEVIQSLLTTPIDQLILEWFDQYTKPIAEANNKDVDMIRGAAARWSKEVQKYGEQGAIAAKKAFKDGFKYGAYSMQAIKNNFDKHAGKMGIRAHA